MSTACCMETKLTINYIKKKEVFFLMFIYFEREEDRACEWRTGRERERERETETPSRLTAVSTEPEATWGSILPTVEIVTRAEIKS